MGSLVPFAAHMANTELPVVQGFRFAAVAAGLKKSGGLDVGAIVADAPVAAAGVFTRNIVRAAPVQVAEQRVNSRPIAACLVNAGCANACTGAEGLAAAKSTTQTLALALGVDRRAVVPASTGVIGLLLPAEKVNAAIPALVEGLSEDRAQDFAKAICTTDRYPKTAHHSLHGATAVGIAKGAGMIHPNMATTLGFVVCDAVATQGTILRALRIATDRTFNRASVDGDTSTNDMIVAMCSAKAGGRKMNVTALVDLFEPVLSVLARMIVADGEGAKHTVRIRVEGCSRARDAETIARTIATSNLVKTALHGRDPNWGRILAAAGRAGVKFSPGVAKISVGDVVIVERGVGVGVEAEAKAREVMQGAEYAITLRVGSGKWSDHYDTCDFGHDYIDVNANYRS